MAQGPQDAAGQGGLACAELAGEVDDHAAAQAGSERGAEGEGVGFGGEEAGRWYARSSGDYD